MTIVDLLKHSRRREVKAMTELLAELKAGHHVRATMTHERYGVFVVEGPAYWSGVVKNLMVGSLIVDSNLKPDKSLLSITLVEESARDKGSLDAPVGTDPSVLHESALGVEHSRVVRAIFEQKPHGQFTVTGIAVESDDLAILSVGTWFIRHNRTANPRLVDLEILGFAADEGLAVPRRIVSWDSDTIQ
jgi:hypothetical protein